MLSPLLQPCPGSGPLCSVLLIRSFLMVGSTHCQIGKFSLDATCFVRSLFQTNGQMEIRTTSALFGLSVRTSEYLSGVRSPQCQTPSAMGPSPLWDVTPCGCGTVPKGLALTASRTPLCRPNRVIKKSHPCPSAHCPHLCGSTIFPVSFTSLLPLQT